MTFDRFLREACPPLDLEWRKYRRRSARHRVDERVREVGVDGYGAYLELLRSDARESALFPDLMRVTVSRFFREEREWQVLRDRILPGIMAETSGAGSLHAWCAGCCGGEEPYSLALVWLEYLLPFHPGRSMEILATDIDGASLERARRGLYRRESLREVPPDISNRWFYRENSLWRLDEKARSLVSFEKRNLAAEAPRGIDLALCRYLAFTYYRGERLRAAARKLWEALRPGGILMIGGKEVLPASTLDLFVPMPESPVFYRRRG